MHPLIGVGDFSHGDENIWKFRLKLLKKAIKATKISKKQIVIYQEDTEEHCRNIMFDPKIQMGSGYGLKNGIGYGPLYRYCYRTYDSKIFLKIIKYIRKHWKRITIIGVDADQLARDKIIADNILKNLDEDNINFFWAHNAHVDDRLIVEEYECKSEVYRAGTYLRDKLGKKYLIILSTAFEGKIRFEGHCKDRGCKPDWILSEKPFFVEFKVDGGEMFSKKRTIISRSRFRGKLIEFSVCKLPGDPMIRDGVYADLVVVFGKARELGLIGGK